MLVGIYSEGRLVKSYTKSEHTSEILPVIFNEILQEFKIKKLYYARGPGSFMAIKISYIFLKTISIVKEIEFLSADGFEFNKNTPIKAFKKAYFVKKSDKIDMEVFNEEIPQQFLLPQTLKGIEFEKENEPLYILPAV